MSLNRDQIIEAAAKALDRDWNPDRYPITSAMFRDYAATATDVVLRLLADDLHGVTYPGRTDYALGCDQGYADAADRVRSLLAEADR